MFRRKFMLILCLALGLSACGGAPPLDAAQIFIRAHTVCPPVQYGEAVWSADGSQIFYSKITGNRTEVWMINADGSGAKRLADDAYQPTPSPDGTMLLYGQM